MRNVTEIQRWLIAKGYLAARDDQGVANDDGIFGTVTLAAYNRARAAKGEGPHTGLLLLVEVNADLFGEDPHPVSIKPPNLFTLIGLIGPILNLVKGKTMTNDQFGGLVRAILTFVAGIVISKGWIDAGTAGQIVAGAVTLAVAAWSFWTNRPAKIVGK